MVKFSNCCFAYADKKGFCTNFTHQLYKMKKHCAIFLFILFSGLTTASTYAQCSICTKTAGQLGEKKAQSLNSGIIYLMLTPFAIAGYIGYRWWKGEKQIESADS